MGGGGGLEQDRGGSWGCQPGEEPAWDHGYTLHGCSGLRIGVPCALMAKLERQGSWEEALLQGQGLPRRESPLHLWRWGRKQMMSGCEGGAERTLVGGQILSEAPASEWGEDSGFPSEELPDQIGGQGAGCQGLSAPPPSSASLGEGLSSPAPQHSAVSSDPGFGCLPGSQ